MDLCVQVQLLVTTTFHSDLPCITLPLLVVPIMRLFKLQPHDPESSMNKKQNKNVLLVEVDKRLKRRVGLKELVHIFDDKSKDQDGNKTPDICYHCFL